MKPPANFIDVVNSGARLLQTLGARLRVQAEATPESPELWLSVRDLEGLGGRLVDFEEWQWSRGMANLFVTGQDFGVLDELLDDSASPIRLTHPERDVLRAFRRYLQHACDGDFDFDESTGK